MLRKALVFIHKDFLIELSYKMNFFIIMFESLLPIISFFFLGKLIDGKTIPSLDQYGNDYFSFALVGIAFTRYFQLAVTTFADSMRRAQMAGCLEAILSSQTPPKSIIFNSALYNFFSTLVQLVVMFVVAAFVFDFRFSINIFSTVVTFFISLLSFISLGIFSAAGTIIYKKGEPFGFILSNLSAILAGAYFPIAVMPDWLETISYIFPIYYAIDALRQTILVAAPLEAIYSHLFVLVCSIVVLLPLSLYFFEWAIEKGKREGTLIQY